MFYQLQLVVKGEVLQSLAISVIHSFFIITSMLSFQVLADSQGMAIKDVIYLSKFNLLTKDADALNRDELKYDDMFEAYKLSGQYPLLYKHSLDLAAAMDGVKSGGLNCDKVDWHGLQNGLFFTLSLHKFAQSCVDKLSAPDASKEQALIHHQRFEYVFKGITGRGDGKTHRTAYPVLLPTDSEYFIEHSGLNIKERYMTFGENYLGLYEVFLVEDALGFLRHIYFDYGYFIHNQLGVEYPFLWIERQIYDKYILPNAKNDSKYNIAMAQYQQKDFNFDKVDYYYSLASEQGSLVADYFAGMFCLNNISSEEFDKCKHHFVKAAQRGYEPANIVLSVEMLSKKNSNEDETLRVLTFFEKAQTRLPEGAVWLKFANDLDVFHNQGTKITSYLQAINKGSLTAQAEALLFKLQLYKQDKLELSEVKPLLNDVLSNLSKFEAEVLGRVVHEVLFLKDKLDIAPNQWALIIEPLYKAARLGSPEANLILGAVYFRGELRARDLDKSFNYYKKAAQGFNLPALDQLGRGYRIGFPTLDHNRAYTWFSLCATVNFTCKRRLASMTLTGYKNGMEPTQAIDFLRFWTDDSAVETQVAFAMAYLNGLGVEQDTTQAIEWFIKAAKQLDKGSYIELCQLQKHHRLSSKQKAMLSEDKIDWCAAPDRKLVRGW